MKLRALPLGLGLLAVLLVVAAAGAGTTGLAASASVDQHTELLDAAASTFTATVNNTGSVGIGAVELAVPSDWSVTSCGTHPSGWNATKTSTGCRYTSASTRSDDLRAGRSAPFAIGIKPTSGGANKSGTLHVAVSGTNAFTIGNFANASATGSGLDLTAYAWEVLDAVVAASPPDPGSPCPAAQKVARPFGNVLVICGRNASTVSQQPEGSDSTVGGTLFSSPGAFKGGTIAPTGSSSRGVVLGNWLGAASSTLGTGKSLELTVGSASNSTSAGVTLDGYSAVEHAPVAQPDTFAGTEDTVLSLPVTGSGSPAANDTDADGDTLTVTAVSSPTGGTVEISGSHIRFHPSANLCGSAAGGFDYTVSDIYGGTDTGHVTVNLTCVNDAPKAVPDTWSGYENTVRTWPLLGGGSPAANDTDVDGDTLRVSAVSSPTGGTVTIVSNQIKFTPAHNLCGTGAAGFDYTVSDGNGGHDSAHDTINLRCVANQPPTAVNDTFSAVENTVKYLPLAGTGSPAANDTDPNGDKLFVSAVSSPTGGAVTIASGKIRFTPTQDRCGNGAAAFTYTVSDGNGGTDTGRVTLNIPCVDHPPVAHDDTYSDDINTVLTLPSSGAGSPAANDTDVDGDNLYVKEVSNPTGGSVAIVSGQIRFTPTTDLCGNGAGGFDYVVADGRDGRATGHVTVNISCTNHPPTNIALSPSSIAENQPIGTTVGTLSATDPDAGQTFSYALVAGTGSTDNGDFTISGSTVKSAVTFDFETQSSYSIRVRVTDSGSPAQTFDKQLTITVTDVNEAPTDIALSSTHVNEGEAIGTAVGTFSATDPDSGQTFTYALVAGTGSADNSSFTVSGQTLKTAAVFDYLAKSSYSIRARVTDSGNPALSYEKQFTITVDQVTQAPTVTADPADTTVNEGDTASFSSTADGAPAPTVQWQLSTNGGSSWSDISSATSATLSFTAAAGDDGNEYRAVWTNSTGNATSAAATLTVDTVPAVTTDPGDSIVNAGDTASFTSAANGKPTPSVQWQVSTNGGSSWSDVPSATSGTLSFSASAGDNGNEYRAVWSNAAGATNSAAATLTVDSGPSVTTDPSDSTVDEGDTASFTSAADGNPAPTVQWQVSTNSGGSWSDVPGATSATLSFTAADGDNGNEYRAVWTNSVDTATSQAATLTVHTAPVVTTDPSDSTVNAGDTASFTAAADGRPVPTVQWQVSTNGGSSWSDLSGETSGTLSFTAAAGDDGNEYRAVFTNAAGSANSAAATLTVDTGPVVTTDPSDSTVDEGDSASFTSAADGKPTPTVQWQVSTNGGSSFSDIPGATSSTLSFTAAAGDDANEYRAVWTNSVDTATSAAATLTVDTVPTVTADPSDQTVAAGATASFTSTADGNPAPTAQWQVSTNGGSSWNDIPGATSTTLSFAAVAGDNGKEYRAAFTNAAGTVQSAAATLTVDTLPVVTTDPATQTVVAGATATFTAAATSNASDHTVQWQVSTDSGGTWNDIPGATSTTLSFTTVTGDNGKEYRAVFSDAAGSTPTAAATLTIDTLPVVTTNPVSQTVAAGGTATFTAAATSNASDHTVQWQVSTNGGSTFNDIPGATSTTLSFTAATGDNGKEYRAVFSDAAGSTNTSAATLSVDTLPVVTTNPADQTVGAGSTATFTAAATSNASDHTVQWQVSTNGGSTFNNIPGATSTTLSFTAVAGDNGKEYRAVFSDAAGSANTSAATLTVDTLPVVTTNPATQTVAAGNSVSFTAAATSNASDHTVQWQVSTNGGSTFGNVPGATSTTLSFTTASGDNGKKYRAVFTDAAGSTNTSAATLTVDTLPVVTTNPADQTVVAGSTATFTAAATSNASDHTVQWSVSTNGGSTFSNVPGATSTTLSFTTAAADNGNEYRAEFSDAAGSADTTVATLTVNSTPPSATDDSYTATGNVGLTMPVASGVLANDTLNSGTLHGFGATSGAADGTVPNGTNSVTTSNGGTVVLSSDGSFTYDPPAGYTGADGFYYDLHNTTADAVGHATITISNMIWFVNNSAGSAGDGRLDHPFNSLSGLASINSGAAPHPQNSDTIFVYTGSGAYTGGITLRNSQQLIGQGASAGITAIDNITLAPHSNSLPSTGGTAPSFTAASGSDVTLGSGNTIRGVALGNRTGSAISGSSFGTLTVATDVSITGSGQALSLTTGAVSGAFGSVTSTSGTNGISLSAVTGTVSATGGALSGASGDELTISGGTANVTYAGTITKTGAGHVVNVGSATGGTIALTGAVAETDGNASGTGVSLTSNTGATITFSGGLQLSTAANTSFTATGGGTVNVNNSSVVNTLTSTGSALNVSSTTIGATGLKFQSITAGGGTAGISLSSTGATGGLTVTGTGSGFTGGTIQGASTAGVLLSSTSSVSLSYMQIKSNTEGIKGTTVNGFALANSTVSGNGSSAGQNGIDFSGGLTGTSSVSSSTITTSADNNMIVTNSSGVLSLTVTGSTFSSTTSTTSTTNNGLEVDSDGTASSTVSVTTSTFNNNHGYHFYFETGTTSSGTNSVTFSSNTLTSTLPVNVNPVPFGSVRAYLNGTSTTAFTANSNNSQGSNRSAFDVTQIGTSSASTSNVKFTNNTVGTAGTLDSGAHGADILLHIQGSGTMNALATGNNLFQYNDAGIDADSGSGAATLNFTASGNTIGSPGTFGSWGFLMLEGATTGDNPTFCASFGANSISGSGEGNSVNGNAYALEDVEIDWYYGTFKLPGYAGSASDASGEVESYLQNKIGGSPTAFVFYNSTPNFVNTASCPTPP